MEHGVEDADWDRGLGGLFTRYRGVCPGHGADLVRGSHCCPDWGDWWGYWESIGFCFYVDLVRAVAVLGKGSIPGAVKSKTRALAVCVATRAPYIVKSELDGFLHTRSQLHV